MAETKRPNIIFLMTDQHRWDALGCVNPLIRTPHLDALCAQGVRFDQTVCNAPMCVPSRYSMMLGLYPSQCGVRHNTSFCASDDELPLPPLPQRLNDLGYQTAGFGKTHWYIDSRIAPDIQAVTSRRGFEVRAQARGVDPLSNEPDEVQMAVHSPEAHARYEAETQKFGIGGESPAGYAGLTSQLARSETREGWLMDRALEFLDCGRDPARPLMLYLSFDFPHAPFNVPAGYEELYDIEQIPDMPAPPWQEHPAGHVGRDARRADTWETLTPLERRRTTLRYYALCSFVDDLFGQLLERLRKMGELDDALIVFVSDHGEMLGQRGHHFSKYCLYDGSVRVPLVLAGSRVPQELRGTVDSRPAELVDVLPTLLDVAGAAAVPELVGQSLLSPPCRLGSFCEMHGSGYGKTEAAPAYMWRTSQWKLILHIPGLMPGAELRLDETGGELYHLTEDPHEWHNRYDDPACLKVRENLTRQLLMHLACAWSRWPRTTSRCQLEADAAAE